MAPASSKFSDSSKVSVPAKAPSAQLKVPNPENSKLDFAAKVDTQKNDTGKVDNKNMPALNKTELSGDEIVEVMSYVLNEAIKDRQKSKSDIFTCDRLPKQSLRDYIVRIAEFSEASDTALILALIYLNMYEKAHPQNLLNPYNIHRLVLVAIMVAAKFFDDRFYNNALYARTGGVSTTGINELEVNFLFDINFNLFINPDLYSLYYQELITASRGLQSLSQSNSLTPAQLTPQVPAQKLPNPVAHIRAPQAPVQKAPDPVVHAATPQVPAQEVQSATQVISKVLQPLGQHSVAQATFFTQEPAKKELSDTQYLNKQEETKENLQKGFCIIL